MSRRHGQIEALEVPVVAYQRALQARLRVQVLKLARLRVQILKSVLLGRGQLQNFPKKHGGTWIPWEVDSSFGASTRLHPG